MNQQSTASKTSERDLLQAVMIRMSEIGARIFRNNQGVAVYQDGSRVKYGIANPGGSDLIGFVPVTVTPEMVGSRLAVFVAVEVKMPFTKTTKAQKNFLRVVNEAGGRATVAYSVEDAMRLVSP